MEHGFESWFRDHQTGRETPDSARKASGPERPHGWFYGLPRYRQGFVSAAAATPTPKEPPPPPAGNPTAANGVQKKFLVFDRSGDRTTLIYTSDAGAPPLRYHLTPKPESPFDVKNVYPLIKPDRYESTEEEDTEELNALLYSSDDETDSSENEETSTGHSPSKMTGSETRKRPPNPNGEEEAASCEELGKRQKIGNGGYDVNPLEDTASSGVNCSGGGEEQSAIEKRRVEVKAAVARLRNLIPGGKNCDDAVIVIDEAIRYLRDLKEKALVLGLDSR